MRKAVWITGVPATGKTALGTALTAALRKELQSPCAFVDANMIREKFWPHLGFTNEERVVNVTGMSELGGVFLRTGSDVVVACIAPDRQVRNRALGLLRVAAQHVSVYQVCLTAPLRVLRERDDKGLYQAYEEGELVGLTGLDAPYEEPLPEEALFLDMAVLSIPEAAERVLEYVQRPAPVIEAFVGVG